MAAWGLSTVHDKSMATHKPPEGVLLHCQPNPHSFLQPLARWSPCPALHGGLTDIDDETLGDDGLLDAWMLAHLGTAIHLSGSAPMGAVVDAHGRAAGVLRQHEVRP